MGPKVTCEQFEHLVRSTIPMSGLFDFKVESLAEGSIRIRMEFNDRLVRAGGSVAGPVLFTLADMALYGVCLSLIGLEALAVTSNLNIHFLSKPKDIALIAEGSVIKLGRNLMVGEVKIRSEGPEATPVALAVGTYSIPQGTGSGSDIDKTPRTGQKQPK